MELLQALSAKLSSLRPVELREVEDFFAQPTVSEDVREALTAAEAQLSEAKLALKALSVEQLDHVRTTETPSPALKMAVEATCLMLEVKPDFAVAQSRLMRSTQSLNRRLLHFDAVVPT